MNLIRQNWFVLIAVLVLFGALSNMPYGYFQLLRWVVCSVGIYSAYINSESKHDTWAWVFGIIAVLFNPIRPFYFKRDTWQILDIVSGVIFLVSIFSFKKKEV